MKQILKDLHLLNHPFYRDWMEGKLTIAQLQDYAQQYQHHVDAFPRYLSAIHSHCADPQIRRVLLDNLNDEEGVTHGEAHPDLWRKFATGMGAAEACDPRAGIVNVVDTFFDCARSTFAAGLGALYAYESQVPEIAESKIEGLKSRYGIKEENTLRFFEAHRSADVYHREALLKILNALPDQERKQAEAAAETAARSLWDFLTEVHEAKNVA